MMVPKEDFFKKRSRDHFVQSETPMSVTIQHYSFLSFLESRSMDQVDHFSLFGHDSPSC